MTRPRTVTSEAILDAARDCVIERGPAVSLDVIAERVGVTSPALLKRFGSRQKLIIQALRPSEVPAWVRELEKGPDDRPLQEQLADFIGRVFAFFNREMPCMTALSEAGFPVDAIFDGASTPPPFRNIWALAAWLKRAQARGLIAKDVVPGGDFESVAMGILGGLHGRVFLSDFMGTDRWRRSGRQYVTDLARIYARALAPHAAKAAATSVAKSAAKTAGKRKKP